MLYGLDTAYAPTLSAAKTMYANGWRWFGGYIGGPRASHAWTHADFARLASAGFVFAPIYVGRTSPYDSPSAFNSVQGIKDAREATILTGACGFNESTPLVLDAEYGDWQNEPANFRDYLLGFASIVNGAGHQLVLYSDMETLNQFGPDVVDFKWGAAYQRNAFSQKPPVGRWDPTLPPPWDCWQFDGSGGTIAGVSVDLNSARDDFPFAHFTPT